MLIVGNHHLLADAGSDYGGYSDIARYPDGTIGVLYEYGFKNIGGIAFQNVELSQLQ